MTRTKSTATQDQRWSRIEAVFTAALDTPPEARETLLVSSCTDESVLAEVRRLLVRHDSLSSEGSPDCRFLDAIDLARATLLCSTEDPDPARVGRYEIMRRLGRGATGIVYLARDSVLDREVALKLLAPYLSADPHAVRRFSEEARAASALDHPHIAAIYDFGCGDDDRFFIAMAYHEGETLRDRLGRGALPTDEAVRIARELADGLSGAHAKGIVHRDIKPENILLTSRGAIIVDFGIAKVVGHTLTRTGAAIGTAAYMSPEQTRSTGIDHRSDVWSLGVVLYEMITGRRPFQTDGGEALVYAIRHDAPAPVTDHLPHIGSDLARAVERCLAKDPERRYPSATALLSALSAPGLISGHRSVRRTWKRIGLAVAGLGVFVAILLTGGRYSTKDHLVQASTVMPLTRHPGSLAVFPFAEGPGDDSLDRRQYLVEGIAEGFRDELLRVLSGTPGLRVTDRASVRLVADAGSDVPAMGRRLGVSSVLKWSLRRSDSIVTVSAELVRAADGRVLWSKSFTHPWPELGLIAEDVRRRVASTVGLPGTASTQAPRHLTDDLVAYDLYLRGRFAHGMRTAGGLDEAAALFGQAISRDPGFAMAYAWLADVYVRSWSGAATGRFSRVQPLVARALELDSTLAYAHRIAGYVAAWQDHDWSAAERHLRRALALDSSDIWNYHFYASYLAATGRIREALAMARRATAVDPISSITATQVGFYLFLNRQYPEAIAVLERAMQVDTVWWKRMPVTLGRAYLAMGRTDEAIGQFRRAGLETSHGFEAPALLAYALGTAGRITEARALAAQYVERARGSSARPVDLVAVHLGLGDTAQALDWVERLPDDRGSRFFLLSDPMFDPLRGSPRFERVLERLKLGPGGQTCQRARS